MTVTASVRGIRLRSLKTDKDLSHLTDTGHTSKSEHERNICANIQQKMPTVSSTPNSLNSLNIFNTFSTSLLYMLYCRHVVLILCQSLVQFAKTRERTACGQAATSSTSSSASWASWTWSSCAAFACTNRHQRNFLHKSLYNKNIWTYHSIIFLVDRISSFSSHLWQGQGMAKTMEVTGIFNSAELGLQLFYCLPAPKLIQKRT